MPCECRGIIAVPNVAVNEGKVLHRAIHIAEEALAQTYDGMATAVKMSLERPFTNITNIVVQSTGNTYVEA